jgi:hypothetical protein
MRSAATGVGRLLEKRLQPIDVVVARDEAERASIAAFPEDLENDSPTMARRPARTILRRVLRDDPHQFGSATDRNLQSVDR